jgi:PBP1b-binding outer membrane lipoprotein LpoB
MKTTIILLAALLLGGCSGSQGYVKLIDQNENGKPEQMEVKWYRTGDIETGVMIESDWFDLYVETESKDFASKRWAESLPEIMKAAEPFILRWMEMVQ